MCSAAAVAAARAGRSGVASASLLAATLGLFGAVPALAHEAHRAKPQATAPAAVAAVADQASAAQAAPHTIANSGGAARDATAHEAAGGHAHPAADAIGRPPSNAPKLLAWLGRFHPPLIHFPIALISVAAATELAFLWTARRFFADVTLLLAALGASAAIAAALLGWFFAGFYLADGEQLLMLHRWLGTATAAVAGAVLWFAYGAWRTGTRTGLRVALFTAAALVSVTGFLGGALVYGLDHSAW